MRWTHSCATYCYNFNQGVEKRCIFANSRSNHATYNKLFSLFPVYDEFHFEFILALSLFVVQTNPFTSYAARFSPSLHPFMDKQTNEEEDDDERKMMIMKKKKTSRG